MERREAPRRGGGLRTGSVRIRQTRVGVLRRIHRRPPVQPRQRRRAGLRRDAPARQKRDKGPIEVLGKIGDERATETLHDYIDGDGDPALQKVTLRALGAIGSAESVQPVANRLDADSEEIRSVAARTLACSVTPALSSRSATYSSPTTATPCAPPPRGRSDRSGPKRRSRKPPATRTTARTSSRPKPRRRQAPESGNLFIRTGGQTPRCGRSPHSSVACSSSPR